MTELQDYIELYKKHNVLFYLELPLRKTDQSPSWMCAFIYVNDTHTQAQFTNLYETSGAKVWQTMSK